MGLGLKIFDSCRQPHHRGGGGGETQKEHIRKAFFVVLGLGSGLRLPPQVVFRTSRPKPRRGKGKGKGWEGKTHGRATAIVHM